MERYTQIILVHNSGPGLYILKSKGYAAFMKKNPGFVHENCGDFYSDIKCQDLGYKIFQILTEDLGNEFKNSTLLMTEKQYSVDNLDQILLGNRAGGCIIQTKSGVRIYSSKQNFIYENEINAYLGLSYLFLEDLFTSKKQGNLQKHLNLLGISSKVLRQELKKVYEEFKKNEEEFLKNEIEKLGKPN